MSKYKKEYEEIIIALDDYVNLLMVKESMSALNGNSADMTASFQTLNLLNGVKGALNNVMKVVDEH